MMTMTMMLLMMLLMLKLMLSQQRSSPTTLTQTLPPHPPHQFPLNPRPRKENCDKKRARKVS
ncbi:hypothetical protein M758_1G119000 [Ceratodon purpureus]|uniref:Secreted protein n=1 Tax=Ceratodon purpureus TaxID=3225 RepID=A0A8T0J6F7_CERPU|nr:hypothetical protein KC19_1G124700 [Ceratodon purpureus]KAG0629643.1 hypothetical protein M758_1G119000 [Ceratodon purpureus]